MTSSSRNQDQPIIAFQDVYFAYPSPIEGQHNGWALNGLNLQIQPGQISAIMGPTGAGKSTLAKAMIGIAPQSTGGRIRGKISVCGLDAIHDPIPQIAQRVGLVFQDPESQFLASSVAEEVAFGLESLGVPSEAMPARIQSALEQVGLQGLDDRSPHQLSGGQKQRVAIASILAMKPEVLILDEASASLDPAGSAELRQVLDKLRTETATTIILITNQANWVGELADHVFLLVDGAVKLEGPPTEVFEQVPFLQEVGLKPPTLKLLQHELSSALGRDIHLSTWEQAAQEIEALIKHPA